MTKMMKTLCTAAALALLSSVVAAKLPAPSDEAKAKAAEAAAKTAWAGKVDGFLLCKSQDKVVAHYKKSATKVATVAVKGAAPASACADPGPFVYVPAGAAPAAAAAPAAPAAVPAKKS